MKRRTILLGGLTGLIGLKIAACSQSVAASRYRLRIAGKAVGKPFIGSTVFECRWWDTRLVSGFDAMSDWEQHTYGDAAIIDLGGRGLLFGLWSSIYVPDSMGLPNGIRHSFNPDLYFLVPPAYQNNYQAASKDGTIFKNLALLPGAMDVPKFSWPIFVRFRDISDIRSVELVNPHDLAATYGPDSAIDRITFELSDAPISRGIENRLPWWDDLKSHRWQRVFNGPVGKRPLYADLEARNFKIDVDKS